MKAINRAGAANRSLRQRSLIALQSRSRSCGVNEIYDGTFAGKLIPGQGIAAKLLMQHGFHVVDVEELR